MANLICKSCNKRKTCRFGKDLEVALHGLTSMVTRTARAQIEEIVAKDIGCGDYTAESAPESQVGRKE